jgi:hypothetical protein
VGLIHPYRGGAAVQIMAVLLYVVLLYFAYFAQVSNV